MALHRSEEVRQQLYLVTFIALLCVDHYCWWRTHRYVLVRSHCIGNKKLSVHKKHGSRPESFCYSFVDARNPGPYDLLSYIFASGQPKTGPVIDEVYKRTNVPLYFQFWIAKTTQGVEGSVLTGCVGVTLHLAFASSYCRQELYEIWQQLSIMSLGSFKNHFWCKYLNDSLTGEGTLWQFLPL